jgi:DNA-damage-inducible protein D
MSDITKREVGIFDSIRRVTSAGTEYWLARELQEYLGYDTWDKFEGAIRRAMDACDGSGVSSSQQFRETAKMVRIGSGAQREVNDYFLSRYACYLVAMNSEPTKAKWNRLSSRQTISASGSPKRRFELMA